MNITVYLGSGKGNDPTITEAVRELGEWIGRSGNSLVYGGSKIGIMGVLAESVIENGGKAIGVEPQFLIDRVLQYDKLTELIATKDMSERKDKMIELGDVFIAMPGGTGTLEEISEIMSKVALGLLDAPCIVYNHNGYYDDLKKQLGKMNDFGFSDEDRQSNIYFADSIDGIKKIIAGASDE
ncbi:MAG: TIGR00730 family Rossman fold protein [Firmicutes bacterium]|nr:TIGR00730 family Rossman fold protein [Bacillota bacterium]